MSQSRRLAAILAADVAGYSRLIGANEEGTLGQLKAIRAEIKWDSPPKIRFAPDSPLEGNGFEPSVPGREATASRRTFVASITVPVPGIHFFRDGGPTGPRSGRGLWKRERQTEAAVGGRDARQHRIEGPARKNGDARCTR